MKNCKSSLRASLVVSLALLTLGTSRLRAATEHWIGVPGVSASTNWNDAANWSAPQQTYYNEVQFLGTGAAANTSTNITDCFNSATGPSQVPIWDLDFTPTNGNYTTLINPGLTLTLAAGNGTWQVGADILHGSAPATPNAVETIRFIGSGAAISNINTLYLSQGSSQANDTHNVTLDLSQLDLWQVNGPAGGQGNSVNVACNGTRNNASLYMARTNYITLGSAFQICNQSASNSVQCAVYLGDVNFIKVGNGNLVVGGNGTTYAGASITFNPAFLGGATPPTASFTATNSSGRINNFYICNENGNAKVSGSAYADFTGGSINMLVSTMQIAQSSGNSAAATGMLTYDNGLINVNNATVANQTTGFASGAGAAVGTVNLNANSTYGTNANLVVNNTLTLGQVTGAVAPGTMGTINVNGGSLSANVISNGLGGGMISVSNGALTVLTAVGAPSAPLNSLALTNSTLTLGLAVGATNSYVSNLVTGGANVINILNVPALQNYPAQFTLLTYSNAIGGAGYNFTLGTIPNPATGYLSNDTANGAIDLILTGGPQDLTWTGANNGNWDFTTANWEAAGPSTFTNGDFVIFNDSASTADVDVTTTVLPAATTISNNSLTYDFTGSGAIGGTGGLVKQGTGTVILDNSGGNNYSGTTTISGGILQIGTNDMAGNIPAGAGVVDNGILAIDRIDTVTLNNSISGSGAVVEAGNGGTLHLTAGNSFAGNVLVTNDSTIQGGANTSFGTGSGDVIVANGSTLDADGYGLSKTIMVSGTGVNGNGAIIDSGGPIYDSSGGLTPNLTLMGDTSLNFSSRVDLGSSTGMTLSTGGNPYNLTLSSSGYFEWRDVQVDAALSNIDVTGGTLGYTGSSTAGNPADSLIIDSGTGLTFYNNDGANAYLNKQLVVNDSSTIQNGGGASVIGGTVVLTNSGGTLYCEFNVGGTSLSLTNGLAGNAVLYKSGTGASPLIIAGNSPDFAGGILDNQGEIVLNGSISCGATNVASTIFAGNGTLSGVMDVGGALLPGGANVAGTITVGGLILEPNAQLTNDLSASPSSGNDLVQVNGNVTVNGNTIYINPIGSSLATGTPYPLITYTGTLTGTLPSVATVAPTRYTVTLTNITTTTPNEIAVIVSGNGLGAASLVWNDATGNSEWDVQGSQNWSNSTAGVSPDYFYSQDIVTFDNSILTAANPSTNIDIASGVTVIPTAITNNSTVNYTISGAGQISGSAALYKLGAGTLTISNANTFTGPTIITGGTLTAGNASALGTTGTVTITNGGTLNLNGYGLTKKFLVGGAGFNSNGAIINTGGPVYDSGAGLTNITLVTNATFGGPTRWDLGGSSGATLSTGGKPYSLTYTGNSITNSSPTYWEWYNVTSDAALSNIYIMSGQLGVKGTTTLGSTNGTMTIENGGQMTFWGGSNYTKKYDVQSGGVILVRQTGPTFNLTLTLEGGSTFQSLDNTKQITGPVNLTGLVDFSIGGAPCTFSNTISGNGGIDLIGSDANALVLAGTNTYLGPTIITNGGFTLELLGNGSISNSSTIYVGAASTLNVSTTVSGGIQLASGQTLTGSGAVTGSVGVGVGAVVAPGVNGTGTLAISGAATLQGTAEFGIGAGSNNVLSASTVQYGGTLALNFAPGSLSSNSTYKLFNASSYSGSFANISPATPGPGLSWDTSALDTTGTIGISSAVAYRNPTFSGISASGGNLTLTGTGGTPNGTYHVLTATNLLVPDTNWMIVGGGSFDGSGNFTFNSTVNTNNQAQFYILTQP